MELMVAVYGTVVVIASSMFVYFNTGGRNH
jgi:hypothetical protein